MNRSNLILLILFLNPSLILMLKKSFRSFKWNEYFVDTCCSFNENAKMNLSCSTNEKIHLKLIQIYYNSNEYCSSKYSCCKLKTQCSRRITKYSNLQCDGQNSCLIDKNCFKIYSPCASLTGLYGQYITIEYSCIKSNEIFENETDSNEESIPFIVKLSTSEEQREYTFLKTNFKSSPLFLFFIIFLFLLLLFLTYWLADQIGKKMCREKTSFQTKLFFEHQQEKPIQVQSNSSLTTRIYPSHSYFHPYPLNSYHQRYLTVHHQPSTRQIYSRTFNPYFNY